MSNFFDEDEILNLGQKIERLDEVIEGLCSRLDAFETRIFQCNSDFMSQIKTELNDLRNLLQPQSVKDENRDSMSEFDTMASEDKVVCTEKQNEVDKLPIKIVYCDSPSGNVFEVMNITDDKSLRSLFQIEIETSTMARFFPLADKIGRLKMNLDSVFLPVCDSDDNLIDYDTFEVDKADYGILELVDNTYWQVNKKCFVKCK